MEITFSKQAEEMINQLENKEKIRLILIDLAIKRKMTITGGDVLKYILTKQIPTSIADAIDK